MNKKTKWGIIILVGAGIIGGGIYSQLPKKNDELAAADKVMSGNQKRGKQVLNVNAKVIKPQSLTDEFTTTGVLLPDEEVDLSFETSGKIVEINFEEGTAVKKGQLLAKVNDRQLQAQLQRLVSQLKLAEDRVFRQDALLKRDAVSKEAYEQVKTDLATLNADIEIIKTNIELTELRAPFDGIIGLRQVSVGTYASPTTVVAKLTKIAPLKVEFSVPERYAKQIKKVPISISALKEHWMLSRTGIRCRICHRSESASIYRPCIIPECQSHPAPRPLCQCTVEKG